jgi:hypothetical protein
MGTIVKTNGQTVEIDCEQFANEQVDNKYVKVHCFDERGQPKCPVWWECWCVFTKRRE